MAREILIRLFTLGLLMSLLSGCTSVKSAANYLIPFKEPLQVDERVTIQEVEEPVVEVPVIVEQVPIPEEQDSIPEEQDPLLVAEALSAVFALARERRDDTGVALEDPVVPEKIPVRADGGFRIALMLPDSGPGESVSRHIQEGAELAMFKLGSANTDMVFLDSSNTEKAVAEALSYEVDLILGPVFAKRAHLIGRTLGDRSIPILTFSNDTTVAGDNVLLLGQTPEQEIETVLMEGLIKQKPNPESGRRQLAVAIISQDEIYGRRISNHATAILNDAGLTPVADITIDNETLASEETLRERIRDLTDWTPPPDDSENQDKVAPPKFDIVVIAGDPAFSLRIAPVLAWHDLDPEKVRYMGTSQWSSPAIQQEPSLRGGWYAAAPQQRKIKFDSLWKETGKPAPNRYTILGFDSVALAVSVADSSRRTRIPNLTKRSGFAGFSGVFRLLPNGSNIRLLDVHEITSDGSRVIVTAPDKF